MSPPIIAKWTGDDWTKPNISPLVPQSLQKKGDGDATAIVLHLANPLL
jgi:hypothetical protein